ncbi:MAG: hypothetical protein JWR26_4456 [Pedosphaera sp.]|nr:hypothetical protein [Pedosphaera sp.]
MPQKANITSVDAIKAFKANLIVYLGKARPTLQEVSADVLRTRLWLQNDQRVHWEGQVRRRQKELEAAKAAVFSSKLSIMREVSAAEAMTLQRAKRALDEAEAKLKLIKKWDREFENRTQPLVKQMEKLQVLLSVDLPNAVAYLSQAVNTLDAYANVATSSGNSDPTAGQNPSEAIAKPLDPAEPLNPAPSITREDHS